MSTKEKGSPPDRSLLGTYAAHSHSTPRMESCEEETPAPNNRSKLRRTRSFPNCAEPGEEMAKIKVGICAMDKKARSNPMSEIVKRLVRNGEFDVEIFGDDTILNKSIEDWPDCDCLLSWHSEGFPMEKALHYVELRKPFLLNDLSKQYILFDRRIVYDVLQAAKIPVPKHIVISRDHLRKGEEVEGLVEETDFIEFKGRKLCKPFVEKPASGEDHNIHVYYPQSMGGGVKMLFRKIDNKSAEYNPHHPGTIRRNGSFLYEEFLPTGGTDVKVYTVGPRYAHAEARKSPVVDGKVLRTKDGKEVRFPVLLSPEEKEIARLVTFAFGQKVCGFDLLRSDKGSVVCDVNGWSFVKSSYKYYDDAAGILRTMILAALAPRRLRVYPTCVPKEADQTPKHPIGHLSETLSFDDLVPLEDRAGRNKAAGDTPHWEELRCVLVVIRHGDRTPKQKMKMKVTQPALLGLFERHKDAKGKQAKLKTPEQLQDLLDVTRGLLQDLQVSSDSDDNDAVQGNPAGKKTQPSDNTELREKLRLIVGVLEAGGHFSGINRKVQLKPLRWSKDSNPPRVEEALLILKHGGVLTHAGRAQAETLGSHFRQVMYPSTAGSGTAGGGGLLRLHSTYRHDLKIYSSDEGRVQTSAAAFTKGLLALEGNSLTPILASLVKKDTPMLDAFDKGASEDIQKSKVVLYEHITWNKDKHSAAYTPLTGTPLPSPPVSPMPSICQDANGDSPSPSRTASHSSVQLSTSLPANQVVQALAKSLDLMSSESSESEAAAPERVTIQGMPEDPLPLLYRMVELMQVLVDELLEMCMAEGQLDLSSKAYSSLSQDPSEWEEEESKPCTGERLLLMYDRWRKLHKSFYNKKKDQFDISKVPDIYDSVKYDAIHNIHLKIQIEELYNTARILANAVVPNEYGITPHDKVRIGSRICSQLVGKLIADLGNTREESRVTANLHSDDQMAMHEQHEMDFFDPEDNFYAPNIGSKGMTGEPNSEGEDEREPETFHRLCPSYALDINSPLRHVRTRIYFTSESHIHGLMNILRYGHLNPDGTPHAPLVSAEQQKLLFETPEFDYLTHIVFRMFENTQVPVDDPSRFRVEISFSPGAGYNPLQVTPRRRDHMLPVANRTALQEGAGVTLVRLEDMLSNYAAPRKNTQAFGWMGNNAVPNRSGSTGRRC
ncbi:hypothetical protein BSKO_10110 [Bryopsis sp. KO-2023]|nr:hypothetical protein BSKO_10110 [Bryopsis sp. KO-2023]